jgi:hypothetical protein
MYISVLFKGKWIEQCGRIDECTDTKIDRSN